MRKDTEKGKKELSIMNLTIDKKDNGYELWLDNKRLRNVEGYQINSSKGCTAELTLRLLVNYPTNPKNTLQQGV